MPKFTLTADNIPGLIAPFQGGGDELHQVIHRHPTTAGRIKEGMGEPDVDGCRPLAQVEVWKGFTVAR